MGTQRTKMNQSELSLLRQWRDEPTSEPTGKTQNQNSVNHGIFCARFLDENERQMFKEILTRFEQDFTYNSSSDMLQLRLVAIYALQLNRAIEQENLEAMERLDGQLRRHLRDLRATREARGESAVTSSAGTPAEWASDLLARAKAEQWLD